MTSPILAMMGDIQRAKYLLERAERAAGEAKSADEMGFREIATHYREAEKLWRKMAAQEKRRDC